ncbi:MAG: hypothetical protein LBU32_19040 [Clostridiales bacterium]|nr:hypothetical protein [Clostridiales bacterium]
MNEQAYIEAALKETDLKLKASLIIGVHNSIELQALGELLESEPNLSDVKFAGLLERLAPFIDEIPLLMADLKKISGEAGEREAFLAGIEELDARCKSLHQTLANFKSYIGLVIFAIISTKSSLKRMVHETLPAHDALEYAIHALNIYCEDERQRLPFIMSVMPSAMTDSEFADFLKSSLESLEAEVIPSYVKWLMEQMFPWFDRQMENTFPGFIPSLDEMLDEALLMDSEKELDNLEAFMFHEFINPLDYVEAISGKIFETLSCLMILAKHALGMDELLEDRMHRDIFFAFSEKMEDGELELFGESLVDLCSAEAERLMDEMDHGLFYNPLEVESFSAPAKRAHALFTAVSALFYDAPDEKYKPFSILAPSSGIDARDAIESFAEDALDVLSSMRPSKREIVKSYACRLLPWPFEGKDFDSFFEKAYGSWDEKQKTQFMDNISSLFEDINGCGNICY